jgi:hypothetical protein
MLDITLEKFLLLLKNANHVIARYYRGILEVQAENQISAVDAYSAL